MIKLSKNKENIRKQVLSRWIKPLIVGVRIPICSDKTNLADAMDWAPLLESHLIPIPRSIPTSR